MTTLNEIRQEARFDARHLMKYLNPYPYRSAEWEAYDSGYDQGSEEPMRFRMAPTIDGGIALRRA